MFCLSQHSSLLNDTEGARSGDIQHHNPRSIVIPSAGDVDDKDLFTPDRRNQPLRNKTKAILAWPESDLAAPLKYVLSRDWSLVY